MFTRDEKMLARAFIKQYYVQSGMNEKAFTMLLNHCCRLRISKGTMRELRLECHIELNDRMSVHIDLEGFIRNLHAKYAQQRYGLMSEIATKTIEMQQETQQM